MNSFIGRKKEFGLLKNDLLSNRSYLSILIGRRGAGKTSLINKLNHFIEKKLLK